MCTPEEKKVASNTWTLMPTLNQKKDVKTPYMVLTAGFSLLFSIQCGDLSQRQGLLVAQISNLAYLIQAKIES